MLINGKEYYYDVCDEKHVKATKELFDSWDKINGPESKCKSNLEKLAKTRDAINVCFGKIFGEGSLAEMIGEHMPAAQATKVAAAFMNEYVRQCEECNAIAQEVSVAVKNVEEYHNRVNNELHNK